MDSKIAMLNMMAKMLPMEIQIEKVEEALQEHKILGNKATKGALMASMMLLMTGLQIEDMSMEDVMKKTDSEAKQMRVMDNLLNPDQN